MVANATLAIVYTTPGSGGDPVQRKEAARAVCARKGWLEYRYQCYLWKSFPSSNVEEPAEGKQATEPPAKTEMMRDRNVDACSVMWMVSITSVMLPK